jgi:hypothetical protein
MGRKASSGVAALVTLVLGAGCSSGDAAPTATAPATDRPRAATPTGVVLPSDEYGTVVAHDGGNGWSFGVIARFLNDGSMVFWITNHARSQGTWNLETLGAELTLGIAERVRDDS